MSVKLQVKRARVTPSPTRTTPARQRGNTLVGVIIGLVLGLGAALAVAVYVTKVPVPFMNKNQARTPEQDAAESRKNQNWDPNAPLYGKNPVKPPAPPEGAASVPAPAATPNAAPTAAPTQAPGATNKPRVTTPPTSTVDPAAAPDATPGLAWVLLGAGLADVRRASGRLAAVPREP